MNNTYHSLGNPFSRIQAEKSPHLFFGQEGLLLSIIQGISSQEPRSYAIEGLKTFGKTTLLYFLKHPEGALKRYQDALMTFGHKEDEKFLFLYTDFYKVLGADLLPMLYQRAAEDPFIYEVARDVIEESTQKETETVQWRLRRLLNELHRCNVRLVVLLDHLDKSFESMDFETDIFLRSLTHHHAFIVATEENLNQLRRDSLRTSPLINVLLPRRLGTLTDAEARKMIAQLLLSQDQVMFSQAEEDFILTASGMQPFLIAIIGEYFYDLHLQYSEVKDFMSSPGFREQVSYQLIEHPAVEQVFSYFWQELDTDSQWVLSELSKSEKEKDAVDPRIISKLIQRGVTKVDILTGENRIYADLFKLYVHQQVSATLPAQSQPPERRGINGIVGELSTIDRKLYEYLVNNPNRVLTFDELREFVWGSTKASKSALEASVHRLRTRIKDVEGQDRDYIQNVRGKGFIFLLNQK